MHKNNIPRYAIVKVQDKDPFPDLSNAIKNAYHSHIAAQDTEGADDLVRDTVAAIIEEFGHRLTYSCHRVDQELGGKTFKAGDINKLSDTHQFHPREDGPSIEFYSAAAVYPSIVTSRIEFQFDMENLVKAIIPIVSENTGISTNSIEIILYKPTVLEKLPVVLEYIGEKTSTVKLEGVKLRDSATKFAYEKSVVKQTSAGNGDIEGTLVLSLLSEDRSVAFTSSSYILQTTFTYQGTIVWPDDTPS